MSQISFLTHTPEQAAKWRDISRADPERIVETLDIGPTKPTNRWGDMPQDVFPCFAAASELAKEGTAEWHRLLDAGIGETLCEVILYAKIYIPTLPTMSEESRREAMRQVPSGHFFPLNVICNGLFSISKAPNGSERKFLTALKQWWPRIVKHLWDFPQNALRPESSHAIERGIVSQILDRLICLDTSIMSLIDSEADMTVPLLTRYLIHTTEERDTNYLLIVLSELSHPREERQEHFLVKYRKAHPLPKSWLARMMRGASPPRKLFDRCGVHLAQTMKTEEDQWMVQNFIIDLFALVHSQGPEFASDVRRSTSLWTNMLIYMRRSAEKKIDPVDKAADLRARQATANIIGLAANWMHSCFFEAPDQLKAFAELLIRADLFAALDVAIPRVASIEGITKQLIRILFCFDKLASEPGGAALLKGQLPRPRVLHALLTLAFIDPHTRMPRPQSEWVRTGMLRRDQRGFPMDTDFFDTGCWRMWQELEKHVKPHGVCARRVCDQPATRACGKCSQAEYCGEECEKRDVKEHKAVCGIIVHDEIPNSRGLHPVTFRTRNMTSSTD